MSGGLDYDVAILGGGLAGLSLAVRLAAIPHLRTVVIEPRTAYRRDRTWCSWHLLDHPFGAAASARWQRWEVLRARGPGRPARALQTSAVYPYEMIPADRLYAEALRLIAAAPGIELREGCTATALEEGPDHVLIQVGGSTLRAGLVFDSRPPPVPSGALMQRFLGQEIETARAVFEPGTVTLMDFAVPQRPDAVHFLYVLPTSPTTALVEDTWFAPSATPLPDYRQAIRDYVSARFGLSDYEVAFEEEGAIPMSPKVGTNAGSARIIPIGTAGGAIKPSSGYGFIAIQRMAAALASDLAAGRTPQPFQARSPVSRWMDDIFLAALGNEPGQAPTIFHSLFARCRPEPLVRFLNDLGGPADTLQVIAAMRKIPMIRAAVAHGLGGRPGLSTERGAGT